MKTIASETYQLQSGYEMPVLGLGTWRLTGAACERAVRDAIELGYRHIDTAEMYGNESEIGRAIKDAERRVLFITSKVPSSNVTRDGVIQAGKGSLDRLATDYLDLYLVHWPNDEVPIAETMEGMQRLVENGLVRSVGLSNFDVGRMRDAIAASGVPICNNQVEYHPYRPRRAIPEFCREHHIALTAYCPLGKGRVPKDPTLRRVGERHGKSAAQVALRWLLQKGAIVIPKSGSREHLKSNMDLADWALSDRDMQTIDGMGVEKKLVDTTYT